MEPVELNLCPHAKIVFNHLYRTTDRALLTADLLGLALPGEAFLDVSWYPVRHPWGAYNITLYHRSWANVLREGETCSLDVVVAQVEGLARIYCLTATSATH